jgi:hypothetical protein
MPMSNGVTLPEEFPKLTSSPRGRRQSRELTKVSLPTESLDDRHAGPAGNLPQPLGDLLPRGHDDVLAPVSEGNFGLLA